MDVEIQLGSPRHNCDRFGICRIDARSPNGYLPKEGKATATITMDAKQQITLYFHLKSIESATFNKHFANGYFYISATAAPAGNAFHRLGIAAQTFIAGYYPIRITKYYAIVTPKHEAAKIRQCDCACSLKMDSG